jgi:hypothetical protein
MRAGSQRVELSAALLEDRAGQERRPHCHLHRLCRSLNRCCSRSPETTKQRGVSVEDRIDAVMGERRIETGRHSCQEPKRMEREVHDRRDLLVREGWGGDGVQTIRRGRVWI